MVPSLSVDDALWDCVKSLQNQSFSAFQIVIVDNSGRALAGRHCPQGIHILEPGSNIGFGAAINLAAREFPAEFIATLNDDAVADPFWLQNLVETMDRYPEAGMAASHVILEDSGHVDSAGMRIAADGSSKQRTVANGPDECLLPSGSAALYRLDLFTRLGGFDESFFLYCEDTDLGLRARWAGWTCRYVPSARVCHRYSHSAGRASALKAYLVERNRLRVVWKCLPLRRLLVAPFASIVRYVLHLQALLEGRGATGEFRKSGNNSLQLLLFPLRAHWDLLRSLPRLLEARRQIRNTATLTSAEFSALLDRHRISLAEVAQS